MHISKYGFFLFSISFTIFSYSFNAARSPFKKLSSAVKKSDVNQVNYYLTKLGTLSEREYQELCSINESVLINEKKSHNKKISNLLLLLAGIPSLAAGGMAALFIGIGSTFGILSYESSQFLAYKGLWFSLRYSLSSAIITSFFIGTGIFLIYWSFDYCKKIYHQLQGSCTDCKDNCFAAQQIEKMLKQFKHKDLELNR